MVVFTLRQPVLSLSPAKGLHVPFLKDELSFTTLLEICHHCGFSSGKVTHDDSSIIHGNWQPRYKNLCI